MFNFWPFNIARKLREEKERAAEIDASLARNRVRNAEIFARVDKALAIKKRTTGNTLAHQPAATHRSAPSAPAQTDDIMSNPLHPLNPLNPIGVYHATPSEPEPSRHCSSSRGSSHDSSHDSGSSYDCGSSSSSSSSSSYDSGSPSSSSDAF